MDRVMISKVDPVWVDDNSEGKILWSEIGKIIRQLHGGVAVKQGDGG